MGYEFELISKLRQRLSEFCSLRVGPGDDTAVVERSDGSLELLAADMLLAGVHFEPDADPALIGRKALAVNLSDIAAMGGVPTSALISVALPRGCDFAEQLHQGLFDLADEFGVAVAGGDTNSWDGPLVVNVAVTGEVTRGSEPYLRSGAKVGDWILTTGPLGGSIDEHHLTFTPRVREVAAIRSVAKINAMIDISDGLASDLHHILKESNVGATIYADRIPLRPNIADQPDALDRALGDGEDFELLFTLPESEATRLLKETPSGCSLFHVGEIVDSGASIVLADGQTAPLERKGWEHSF